VPRPDVSDERIPQILAAAAKVFNRKGIAATRMEDIAREAKLSVGGVYWYYKGKDDVILAIMDQIIDEDVAALKAMLNEPGTVRERLLAYAQMSIPETLAYVPLTYDLYTLAHRDVKVRRHIQKYFTHYRDALANVIQQGMDAGELRKGNAAAVAATFAALYEGTLELASLDPHNLDAVQMLKQSLTVMFDGLAK
jgi:AcrR family transcriptional regulator